MSKSNREIITCSRKILTLMLEQELKRKLEEQSNNIQEMLMTMACIALYEKFNFRATEIKEFIKEFNFYTQQTIDYSIDGKHFTTVSDVAEFLNEECNTKFDIEAIKKIETMEDKERKNAKCT